MIYVGENNKAKGLKECFVGVNNIAKKATVFVGDENNKARKVFPIVAPSTYVDFEWTITVAAGNPTWEVRFDDGTYTSESGTHTSSGRSVVVTVYGEGNPSISGATIFYGNDYHEMAIVGHEASGIVPDGYDTARISVVVSA